MNNITKSAVILSILSAPSKLGLRDNKNLSPDEILQRLNMDDLKIQEIISSRYKGCTDKVSDLILERCLSRRIKIITLWDYEYPALLKEIHNPPVVLYVAGNTGFTKGLSIVGTRNSDEKSEEITRKIAGMASMTGYTVVSGMAMGIDRNAHMGALAAGGGTVAVLPGGVDMIYPAKKQRYIQNDN